MQFRPLASSSAGCSYIVQSPCAKHRLLLDCGVSLTKIQQATMFELSTFDGCLVSHAHGDHCKSASALARRGIEVYGSKETLQSIGLDSHSRTVLQEKETVSIGPWKVMAFPAVHDCPGTLGFLVSGFGGNLLYLTDSAHSKFTFPGLTHIAVECNFDPEIMRANSAAGSINTQRYKRTVRNHMSLPRLKDFFVAMKDDLGDVKEIWLLHLSDENSDERLFKEEIQKLTGRPVFVAPRGGK